MFFLTNTAFLRLITALAVFYNKFYFIAVSLFFYFLIDFFWFHF